MSERFFVESEIRAADVELVAAEARHAAKVMRLRAGDTITLFDGSGAEFSARITAIGKQHVACQVIERRSVSRELPTEVILCVALPKGDRQRWLTEKAVELGVARLVPLVTERGVAQPTAGALGRLRKTVVAASKQCGRNRLMEIEEPRTLAEIELPAATARLLAHPDSPVLTASPETLSVAAAVGPEGGFTPDEVAAAQQTGWKDCSLGPRTLRVETAAIALAARLGTTQDPR